LLALALFVGLAAPRSSFAGEGRGAAKLERVCAQITCSEAQREDLARVFEQLRRDIRGDREAIEQLRAELAERWREPEPDARALTKLSEKIAAHERNITDRRLEAMLEIHDLLTPAQRDQVADLLLASHARRRE
jgi:Spy/CpxP family protein refolding chaperone